MFNMKTFLRQASLALTLACGALAAQAAPVAFHVDIDTSGRTGAGMIDMMFNSDSSTPVTATLRNFSGAFGSVLMAEQVGFNGDGSVDLANLPDFGAYLKYEVSLGGAFGFDIFFSDDLATDSGEGGSWFSVGLYDALGVLGNEFGIVSFELKPGEGIAAPYADAGFAGVAPLAAAVPEPADWALMATGLALLGASLRRRRPR